MIGRRLLPVLLALAFLAGCKPEPEVVEVTLDTTEWPRHCLGYHSFQAPPEFDLGTHSAAVDGMSITVLANDPTPVDAVIAAQEDFGRQINAVEVNGWKVVVATVDNGLIESDFGLWLIGARRIGADVVVASSQITRETYPKGDDPALWAWHARTSVQRAADVPADAPGYCLSGILFVSPKLPETSASFETSLGLRAPLNQKTGQRMMRSDVEVRLDARFSPPQKLDDARPLATGPDVSGFPGVKVDARNLSIGGRTFGFSTVRFADKGKTSIWYDAAAFNETRTGMEPAILGLKFQNADLGDDDSLAQAVAILSSLRLGR